MFCKFAASLTVGAVMRDELAADGNEFQRLLDAQRGVHRVAGEHGLHDDRMIAAHHKTAVRGIADGDLAGLAALVKIG